MQNSDTGAQPTANIDKRRFREQADGDKGERGDATLSFEGTLKINRDEDTGGDPYNHTGRFKKSIR